MFGFTSEKSETVVVVLLKRVVGLVNGEIIGQAEGATTLGRIPFFYLLASFFVLG